MLNNLEVDLFIFSEIFTIFQIQQRNVKHIFLDKNYKKITLP